MNRGFPSMTALLGLLAVAGYQNRDKIMEMMKGQAPQGATPQGGQGSSSGSLGGLLGGMGNAGIGGLLGGGLSELIGKFQQSGQGDVADSWVGTGPNKELAPSQLEQAVGSDVIDTLVQQTGLSRDEIVSRLTRELPHAVDKYTPDGRLPSESEFRTS